MCLNVIVVTVLIVFGGLVGGTVNYLNLQERGGRIWCKQITLSTAAALLVPLFLALAKSDLLGSLLRSENLLVSSDAFVFLGFCLLGGVASNRFIVSLSERVLREVRQTQDEVEDIRAQTEPLLEQVTEPEEPGNSEQDKTKEKISEEEKSVLQALVHPRYKLRSIAGIMTDTGLPRRDVEKILHDLKSKGLAIEVAKTRQKGIRWAISSRGLHFLSLSDDEAQTC